VRRQVFGVGALSLLCLLSGCTLLFVPRGGSRLASAPPAAVPTAVSLHDSVGDGSADLKYQVSAGDSLESIARAFYGDSRQAAFLAKTNRLKAAAPLKVGRTLRVPAKPPALPSPKGEPPPTTGKGNEPLRAVQVGSGKAAYELEVSGARRAARPKKNRAFGVGEKLKFSVRYFAVLGGYATLKVEALETFHGRPCYRLAAEARSVFPFSNFYTVNDRMVSTFDAVDFFPWRFEKNVREGGYREVTTTEYRPLEHQALKRKNQDAPQTFAVPPFVQDIISTFYYFRLLDFAVGDRLAIPTQAGSKNYELVVEVVRRETVQVEAGKYDCFLLRPHVKYDNIFQNKGEISLWVTADERRLPVKIQSKIVIGAVNLELVEAVLPRLGG